jgi:Rod binding domain-containing protein
VFAQEREALWVEALLRSGRRAEARRRADALFAAQPTTAYRPRLEELLGP